MRSAEHRHHSTTQGSATVTGTTFSLAVPLPSRGSAPVGPGEHRLDAMAIVGIALHLDAALDLHVNGTHTAREYVDAFRARGYEVLVVGGGKSGTSAAKLLAREQGVQINTEIADLQQYQIKPESYDLILNIQYLQRSLVPQIKTGLKHGGFVIFENPTVAELERNLKDHLGRNLRRDFLLEKGELRRLFSDLEIVSYSEGPGEGGEIVARLVARRR